MLGWRGVKLRFFLAQCARETPRASAEAVPGDSLVQNQHVLLALVNYSMTNIRRYKTIIAFQLLMCI